PLSWSFSHTSQAYPVAVDAFLSIRPLTIGTRSVNCATRDGGFDLNKCSYRPTLSMNTVRVSIATPQRAILIDRLMHSSPRRKGGLVMTQSNDCGACLAFRKSATPPKP